MAKRHLYIPGEAHGCANVVTMGGDSFVHLLIEDDAAGQSLIAAIDPVKKIWDSKTTAWKDLPDKWKRLNKMPIHEFSGERLIGTIADSIPAEMEVVP